ncbi:hypothetical protein [Candidatus Methanoperedens nitratireducens]|uniref:Uncharacterized protein n=1 Tax=Candidatus Methanoperedens nitratireducens TaxID=1392998 RepID=A0A284VL14_9EURY|nr:hypothetical protein [Candidatus Methanoperedens nitroreducens]SNQ59955.1 hypothetical protein MNV_1460002 [Candidatus Methanoperedens nitroreducens]
MPISQELLNELKDILREDYGKELSQKELFEVGNSLVLYFDLLARIHSRNKLKSENSERDNPKIRPEFDIRNKPL